MKIFRNIFAALIILYFYSCANMVAPNGGPKDATPPKFVRAYPDTFSTHFNSDEIRIDFNEYIQLKDEMNQVVISPPMEKQPDIKFNKKRITLKFKEKFKDSTTYNINFGNSISDNHEGNVRDGFQYVFSTGAYVDSLSLSGRCLFAKDLKAEKGILVMLYRDLYDSIPAKRKPDYFTKTDSAGYYKISNIKEGTYKLIALKDFNNNYLFDQSNEVVGFRNNPIFITKNDTANLFIFEQLKAKQYLLKAACEEFGKLFFAFNKPLKDFKVDFLNYPKEDAANAYFEYSMNRDTVVYWFTKCSLDTMKMMLFDGTKALDTLNIHIKPKEPKKKGEKVMKFTLGLSSNPVPNQLIAPQDVFQLLASHPLTGVDTNKFILKEDSIVIKGFTISSLDSTNKKLTISYPWKEDSTYNLSFPRGTFHDIHGLTNDTTVNFSFKIKSSRNFGNFKLKFKAPKANTNFIIQLLNEKEEVVQQNMVNSDALIKYNFLNPGKYKVKLIYDANANDKWDTGDYYLHLQPERITYCKEIFTIRANWDIDADWIVPMD
ncbi:MAG: Ig-like domain-containing domain [Bacteroidota bacterium]